MTPHLHLSITDDFFPPTLKIESSTSTITFQVRKSDSKKFCIKTLPLESADIMREHRFYKTVLRSNQHCKFVPQYYGYTTSIQPRTDVTLTHILLEPFPSGDLDHFIRWMWIKADVADKLTIISRILLCLIDALSFVHSFNHAVMDLKPRNILLKNERSIDEIIAAVTDFGEMDQFGNVNRMISTSLFRCYDAVVSAKCDTWSLGLVLLHLCKGSLSPIEAEEVLSRGPLIEPDNLLLNHFAPLLKGLLDNDVSSRLSLGQLMSVPMVEQTRVQMESEVQGNEEHFFCHLPEKEDVAEALQRANTTVTFICAGEEHMVFLTSGGRLFGCGKNTSGQLGRPCRILSRSAFPIILTGVPQKIVAVACGSNHTVALTTSGKILAFGCNKYLQCSGDVSVVSVNDEVETPNFEVLPSYFSSHSFSAISVAAGKCFSAALGTCGRLVVWGQIVNGRAGIIVPVDQFNNIASISGCQHRLYMTTAEGKLLYLDFFTDQIEKVAIVDPIPERTLIDTIVCGQEYCLFSSNEVVKGQSLKGKLFSNGNNNFGQMGIGKRRVPNKNSAYQVQGIKEDVVSFAAASDMAIALTESGKVYVWGENKHCTLGYRNINVLREYTPVRHKFFEKFKAVAVYAGYSALFVVLESGQVYYFGRRLTYGFPDENTGGSLHAPKQMVGRWK
ncbi:hypothetical protein RCL1_002083 [Eukaryota sp. TZLM3-RCL]